MGVECSATQPTANIPRQAPLTWGQTWPWLDFYRALHRRGFSIFRQEVPVAQPDGLPVPAALAALTHLVTRHESLRTRFFLDHTGLPAQTVLGPGEIAPRLIEAAEDDKSDDLAESFFQWSAGQLGPQAPAHIALLVREGRVRAVWLSFSHAVVDLWAMDLVVRELTEVLGEVGRGDLSTGYPRATQPIDQAMLENTPRAKARSDRSVKYWENSLRRIPQTLLPEAVGPDGTTGAWKITLSSSAVGSALNTLTARYGVSTAMLSATAFAAALWMGTGFTTIGLEIQSGNRYGETSGDLVSSMVLPTLAVAEIDPARPVGALVQAAARAVLGAMRHSNCDHAQRMLRTVEVELDRGVRFYALPEFNFLIRKAAADPPRPDVSAPRDDAAGDSASQLVRDELISERVEWADRIRLMISIDDGVPRIVLFATDRAFDEQRATGFVRAVESVLVTTATASREPTLAELAELVATSETPLCAPARGSGWINTDNCRVDMDALRALFNTCAAVTTSAVFAGTPDETWRLRAYVVPTDEGVTPDRLHRWILAQLNDNPSVKAPDYYVICESAPPEPDNQASWATISVLDEGDGRRVPEHVCSPPSVAAKLLIAAVRAAGSGNNACGHDCFATSGADLVRVPEILGRLRAAGYVGLDLQDFLTKRSLDELAGQLCPDMGDGLTASSSTWQGPTQTSSR